VCPHQSFALHVVVTHSARCAVTVEAVADTFRAKVAVRVETPVVVGVLWTVDRSLKVIGDDGDDHNDNDDGDDNTDC